ncbi:MAG: SDR family oxidoreductase [Microcystis sp. Msp_OC_L_20101000_S702]|uniref:SDR family NAD(P)-dependent oxidoreductase n=1 Tax=Microcystis sp. Msp_OC_L_20101000_S702 TaxID=2486218 RepID=UPI0011970902|nr:SDR family NAD(P)-dependent oxidoreductase [Microcystis sp. Msp_OC_L_20101000_S702]TRU12050.1 MAG: SDR family oxidoreductase [Microcystis sp. Msp_OC_L_20101000_S702]
MFPKVVLITGCSSGFGLLTTLEMLRRGFLVIATMRNLEKRNCLEKALSQLDSLEKNSNKLPVKTESNLFLDTPHPWCKLFQLDVTNLDSIQLCVETVIEQFKSIDVLINNAGNGLGGFAEDISLEQFRTQFETNFFGLVTLTQQVVTYMRERHQGQIINVSSIAGLIGIPSLSSYCASKFAVEGFSECLRYELLPFNIWVSLVEPGTYPTNIQSDTRQLLTSAYTPQSAYYERGQRILNKTLEEVKNTKAAPQEVANLIGKIAQTKRPRLRYIIGTESIYVFLKKILPSFIFESLVAHFFA